MNFIESRDVASCESESLRLSTLLVLWRIVANLTSDKIISIGIPKHMHALSISTPNY
jgi:hypothetical protein